MISASLGREPVRPTLPMLPTTPAKATHDYQRNGTLDLFAPWRSHRPVITDLRKPGSVEVDG